MVDGKAPGGTGANDGYWEEQLRDRFGKFMEMGGDVLFEVTLPGVQGEVQAKGKFIGATDMTTARIEVLDNSEIPKGVYLIKTDKIENIQAVIPPEYLEDQLAKSKPSPEPLKKSMVGAEVQKKKLKSIAKNLKARGRFPVPRQSMNDTMGKNSDVTIAAKADYKQVYDASPQLQERYKGPGELWDRVYSLSVDTDWSSPNELSEIPEEMQLINREYAKHFLGLEEDGLITVYRNAVGGKNSQVDAAAGYVSTDMSFAYDYNSKSQNIGANGRYEIDVKPDEVFGMLGYSKPEDEFAFVIGKGVTSQEGRVRRVGDVAPLPMPAPWLQDYEKEISYATGATPYRHHALGGQFNFHEVDSFGDNIEEFFSKYNLTSEDIKSKFDELYGSGAYDEYKASEGTISFNTIRRMFVDLPNGKIGLDITKIQGGRDGVLTMARYGDGGPDTFKNDRTDTTLKMMSVFQELTGQPFFTHRSRDYVPGAEEPKGVVSPTQDRNFKDIDEGSYRKLVAYQNGGSVAQVEYSLVPDETRSDGTLRVEVQYIKSFVEGKGHGQAVMHELYAMYPDSIIDWGETLNETSRSMAEKFDAQYSRTEYRYGEEDEDGDIFKEELPSEEKKTGIFQEYSPGETTTPEVSEEMAKKFTNERFGVGDPPTDVAMLPIEEVEKFVVLDREGEDNIGNSKETIAKIQKELEDGGSIREPLYIDYDSEFNWGVLSEGHHRLAAARKAGLTHVPVRMYRAYGRNGSDKKRGLGSDLTFTPGVDQFGWEPQSAHASFFDQFAKYKKEEPKTEEPTKPEPPAITTLEDLRKLWKEEAEPTPEELAAKINNIMLDEGITEEEILEAHQHLLELHKLSIEGTENQPKNPNDGFALTLIKDWNIWPSGSAPIQFLNQLTKEVFNIETASVLERDRAKVEEYRKHEKVYKSFLLAMHGETQKFFADRGIKQLAVYRGFRVRNGSLPTDVTDVFELKRPESRPLSSWTLDYVQATTFAVDISVIMRGEIPVSQVFSIPFTGFGTKVEEEVVVIGVPDNTKAFFEYAADDDVSPGVTVSNKLREPDKTFDPSSAFSQQSKKALEGSEPEDPQQEDLSEKEQLAVSKYTGSSYKEINGYLNGEFDEKSPPPEIEIIDNVISKNKLSEDMYLYRGIPIPKNLSLARFLNMLNYGDKNSPTILENLGYSSTSSRMRIAETFVSKYGLAGGVVLRINAKAGQNAFFVSGDVGIDYEKEYILPRGTKYKVTGYTVTAKSLNNYEYGAIVDVEIVESEKDGDTAGVIDVVDEQSAKARIEPGFDNWTPMLFDLLDSLEEDEEGEEITKDELGNVLQSKFIKAAGFNGKPKLATQKEFDAIDSETIYRAVANKGFIDDYLNSEVQYAGEGSFGNGTYTTNRRETTEYYAGDTNDDKKIIDERTMEIKLASDANVLSFEEVPEMREWANNKASELHDTAGQVGANPQQRQSIDWHIVNDSDWTNIAIMLGYDAIRFRLPMTENNEYYTIILNRGKAVVNGKS